MKLHLFIPILLNFTTFLTASKSKNAYHETLIDISNQMANPELVVCITGVSNSGKTYFANTVKRVLYELFYVDTEVVHQDYFFMPLDITPVEIVNLTNSEPRLYPRFEEVLSYDWAGLWEYASNVVAKEKSNRVVIIEGSIILQAKRAFSLCDKVFEITVDFETALRRRQARKDYIDMFMAKREFFRDVTWAEHAKYITIAEMLAKRAGHEIVQVEETAIFEASSEGKIEKFVIDLLFG